MIFTWLNALILLFLFAGLVFAVGPMIGSLLLATRATGGDLCLPYECGIQPTGSAWIRFSINYYLYALLFLAFDVDILYLFPVVFWYPISEGLTPLIELLVFLGMLCVAYIYFWNKGVFEWPHRIS
ncbi:NAD(P)H-quinone oxidoreductase subunit 3 [Desulfovibrionales bacterium]